MNIYYNMHEQSCSDMSTLLLIWVKDYFYDTWTLILSHMENMFI
jgi:hypothetical protein